MTSYRVNVFGFPNAKGLADQNLGLLDQRLAYEIPHWRSFCTTDKQTELNGYMTTSQTLAATQIESFCGASLLVQAVSRFTLTDIPTIRS